MKLLIFLVLAIPAASAATLGDIKKSENSCGYECLSDADCSSETACISHKCADPCLGLCANNNTVCKVVNHVAACGCKPEFTGDPLYNCEPQDAACKGLRPSAGTTKKFWIERIKKLDWFGAVMFCMNKGQRLASLTTKQEIDDVKKTIATFGIRDGQFWLGGSDHLYENEWVWFSTNEVIGIKDWGPTQPNSLDGDEDCLELWERYRDQGYQWNDRLCHEPHFFICEYFE